MRTSRIGPALIFERLWQQTGCRQTLERLQLHHLYRAMAWLGEVLPQPDARVLQPATPTHPAKAMTPPQRRQLALEVLAAEFQVAVETAPAVLNVELLPPDDPSCWPREDALGSQLGSRHFSLSVAVAEAARQTVRASSLVENLNSRLRNYFFLLRRKHSPNPFAPSPLAGDAGPHPVLPQLTSPRQPSAPAIPSGQRSGYAPVTQKRAELNQA